MNIVMLWYQHDWGLYGRRYEMIARTWVAEQPGDRLLIVEPPLNPWIWFREGVRALKAGDKVLVGYWLGSLRRLFFPLVQENDRLWVLRPFLWWPFISATANSRWTRFSFSTAWNAVEQFMRDHQWENSLLWAYPPHAFVRYGVDRWKQGRLCIDLVDDNTQYRYLPAKLRENYKTSYSDLLEKADVIFSVSSVLADRHSSDKKRVIHVPNAVSQRSLPAKPWRLPPIPAGTRACYVGRLDERLDIPLLKQIFLRLPKVQFVFIGSFDRESKTIWDQEMGMVRNVHLLGTIPSLYIPSVLAAMDVCILPHLITPLTNSMDPLKLYTYLVAGKPVIATGVNIEEGLKPWVKCVNSAAGFESALNEFLNPVTPVVPLDLSSYAWPRRVATMAGHLTLKANGA